MTDADPVVAVLLVVLVVQFLCWVLVTVGGRRSAVAGNRGPVPANAA